MPRWRQKAVCRGNSGWCVRLPGSPVWKMPAFQTSPAPSANIPPSQPFSLCRSRFLNLLLLLFVLRSLPPQKAPLSFSRLSLSLCAGRKKKKKKYRCFDTSYTAWTRKKQAYTQNNYKNTALPEFLTFPSDRKADLCRVFLFLQIHKK